MKSDSQSSISDPMFFGLLAGGLAGWLAYRADADGVPVVSDALDWCTGHLMVWVPALQHAGNWSVLSGLVAGFAREQLRAKESTY